MKTVVLIGWILGQMANQRVIQCNKSHGNGKHIEIQYGFGHILNKQEYLYFFHKDILQIPY